MRYKQIKFYKLSNITYMIEITFKICAMDTDNDSFEKIILYIRVKCKMYVSRKNYDTYLCNFSFHSICTLRS